MKAYMTNGTYRFLKDLSKKHSTIDFYFMNSASGSLAYYEGSGKSIFASGRDYDIILKSGALLEEGYVVMNNIPVTEEGMPVFENHFKERQGNVDNMPGFQALRLLRPTSGNVYVVLTQWATKQDFERWKNSDDFAKAHKDQVVKPPAYFANKPFVTSYTMITEDEEQS